MKVFFRTDAGFRAMAQDIGPARPDYSRSEWITAGRDPDTNEVKRWALRFVHRGEARRPFMEFLTPNGWAELCPTALNETLAQVTLSLRDGLSMLLCLPLEVENHLAQPDGMLSQHDDVRNPGRD